jgi:hypothetical protein
MPESTAAIRIDIHHHFHVAGAGPAADTEGNAPALQELTMKMSEVIAALQAEAERDTNATSALVALFNETLDRIGTVAVDAPAELESVLAAFRGNTDTLVAAALKGTPAEAPAAPADGAPAEPVASDAVIDPVAPPADPT